MNFKKSFLFYSTSVVLNLPNTIPHGLVTPNHTIIFAATSSLQFGTVVNDNVNT